MEIREDWTSQDKFDFSNYNQMLEMLNKIDNRLNINSPFQRTIKRHIQVGDDLSGKKIYFEFPDDLYDDIINDVAGGQSNIIATDSHSIIEYGNIYNSVATVSIDSWMDTVYYANFDTAEVYNNLTQIQLSDNFGVVTNINSNLSAYQYIYIIETQTLGKQRGDFLISEELQNLENNLEQISNIVNTSFRKRNWYYLSVITFEDINRWAVLLNYAYNIVFEPSKNIITEAGEMLITENNEYLMTEEEE